MKFLGARRLRNTLIVVILAALLVTVHAVLHASLRPAHVVSGWTLFVVIVLLASLNSRKKLPFLPLGSASTWLQFHLYAGWISLVIFGLHVEWSLPNGILEVTLAALFVAVAGSGVFGLVASRIMARRLAAREEETIFERIPMLRRELREEVEERVREAVEKGGSTVVLEFHTRRLAPFFAGPRHFWRHLIESRSPRAALLAEIRQLERYLNASEKDLMEEIAERVREKDDLDYQYALQAMLKRWLFVHIPLTVSLLMVGLVHGLIIHAYLGGVR